MPRSNIFRLLIYRILFLALFLMASFYSQIIHWPVLFCLGYLDSDSSYYQCFSRFNANLGSEYKLVCITYFCPLSLTVRHNYHIEI